MIVSRSSESVRPRTSLNRSRLAIEMWRPRTMVVSRSAMLPRPGAAVSSHSFSSSRVVENHLQAILRRLGRGIALTRSPVQDDGVDPGDHHATRFG